MTWLSYIFTQTILQTSSKYNREIRVNEERGKLKLLVNGSRQSGEYIEKLWKEAFKAFGLPQSHLQGDPLQILVLGVGGGTVIQMLNAYYPNASIIAVDIDQTMIDIGKKYFGLDRLPNISFVCQDAEQFVQKKTKRPYDLVIVDLFIGTHVPEVVRDENFLKNIKTMLMPRGSVVINYLHEFEYVKQSDELKELLERLFPSVIEKFNYNNRFFLCNPTRYALS